MRFIAIIINVLLTHRHKTLHKCRANTINGRQCIHNLWMSHISGPRQAQSQRLSDDVAREEVFHKVRRCCLICHIFEDSIIISRERLKETHCKYLCFNSPASTLKFITVSYLRAIAARCRPAWTFGSAKSFLYLSFLDLRPRLFEVSINASSRSESSTTERTSNNTSLSIPSSSYSSSSSLASPTSSAPVLVSLREASADCMAHAIRFW